MSNKTLTQEVEALIAWGEIIDKKISRLQSDLYRLENWIRDLYAKR